MEAEEIESYLTELGSELQARGVKKPVRILLIYAPEVEYILALKITADRQKDLDDCAILLPKTKIQTRKQAQQVLDRYILPSGQQKNARCVSRTL